MDNHTDEDGSIVYVALGDVGGLRDQCYCLVHSRFVEGSKSFDDNVQ